MLAIALIIASSVTIQIFVNRSERARERLRESEDRHRAVVDTAPDAIITMTQDGLIRFFNPGAESIFGYAAGEVVGKPPSFELFSGLLHSEDRQRTLDALEAHLERGVEYSVEFRLRHSSGEYRNCHARGEAQRDERGAPVRTAGVVQDITERIERENTQRFMAEASEVLSSSLDYRTTLSEVANLAVPTMADWCAVHVLENGSLSRLSVTHTDPEKAEWARELLKRYPDEPQGIAKVMHTGEPEFYPEITDETLETLARDEEHLQMLRNVGLKCVMVVPLIVRGKTLGAIALVMAESGRRYRDEDLRFAQELARRAALAVDNARLYERAREEISEREEAEKEVRELNESLERRVEERTAELREAEARFRSAFDDAAIGMALNTPEDGHFCQVNCALYEMLGYTEEELLSFTFGDITHPDDLEPSVEHAQRLLEGEVDGYQLEKRYLHKDAYLVWVSLNVSAVRSPEGQPLYLVAQMQDITERRQA